MRLIIKALPTLVHELPPDCSISTPNGPIESADDNNEREKRRRYQ